MLNFKKLDDNLKEKLRDFQKIIAESIILKDEFPKPIKNIAGFDLSFIDDLALIAGVVMDYNSLLVKEIKIIKEKLSFPYIPTFLAFREGPPIIKIFKKLKSKPEVLMINGHGISHPFSCGVASYVGVLLDVASIGIAQNLLCGSYKKVEKFGDYSFLIYKRKKVGYAFKSKKGCSPIFISPGHKVSLESTLEIVKNCIKKQKLPEPIYLAHSISKRIKNKYQKYNYGCLEKH